MKQVIIIFTLIFCYLLTYSQKQETFKDLRDGKIYKIVKIGNQTWFAENLAYKPNSGNYWAYDDNNKNVIKYGYLYDWETAQKVCPADWHLPSKDEFQLLLNTLESENKNAYTLLTSSENSGFSSLFSGYRKDYGEYSGKDKNADYWTTDTGYKKEYAWVLDIFKPDKNAGLFENYKIIGLSVRCIKDK
jgi:uncharacterized protein (TIGR02145 family)